MERKFNSASGPCAMPEKLDTTRAHVGEVGYRQARTSRGQIAPPRNPGTLVDQHGKAVTMPGMTLEPSPVDPPAFPTTESGFEPDGPLPMNPDDPQSQQTHQDPLVHETEAKPVVETTAEPPSGGETESVDCPNSSTGSLESPSYPAKVDSQHPVGYPSE
jgi:hypothetical protein